MSIHWRAARLILRGARRRCLGYDRLWDTGTRGLRRPRMGNLHFRPGRRRRTVGLASAGNLAPAEIRLRLDASWIKPPARRTNADAEASAAHPATDGDARDLLLLG